MIDTPAPFGLDPPGVLASAGREAVLGPYVPGLSVSWLASEPDRGEQVIDGTLAFVDISGFTRLTEILSTRGKAGAEEMTGILDHTFAILLAIGYDRGGELVKWGGDAVLLWYSGDGHASRAVDTAWRMQGEMSRIGRLRTSMGAATLRMSVGIHSGAFHFFLVGSRHRELILAGPAVTATAHLEGVAEAGEIVVSRDTARLVNREALGAAKADGVLIAAAPESTAPPLPTPVAAGMPSACLPRVLADHLAVLPVESEHRQVAVAFIQFGGADALLAVSGVEALRSAVDDLISRIQEGCADRGVTFWETDIAEDGGKVMLVAGAPTAADDDAGRLLATVWEVVQGEERLSLRAGVNCGRVFTGGFGPDFRRTYSGKGDAINLAARLAGRAGPGEVLASEAVVQRSRTAFETEAMEPFLVKGKAAPVRAYRLGPPQAGRSSASASYSPGFYGRDSELHFLRARLEEAASVGGLCVQLVGAPGIGKSRLSAELQKEAAGFRVANVVCDRYGSVIPYASLGSLLSQVLDASFPRGDPGARADLLARLERVAPGLLVWAPLIGNVLGVDLPATPETEALDERFRQEKLEMTVIELLGALLPGPSLLVVDDAQWMDDASTSFITRLAAHVAAHPWLVLLGRRPVEGDTELDRMEAVTRLELAPLADEAVATLLQAMVDEYPLAPHHRDAVAARSAGNPLFLLELLEASRHSGFAGELPDTIEGVFAAQVDQLSPADRRLLRAASVLGMTSAEPVISEMLDDPKAFARLSELREFLHEDEAGGLRFRHTLLRDAAYEGLSYATRRALHERAGAVLEEAAGDDLTGAAELLALHFGQAGDLARTWRYARLAGERAQQINANVEAATFFEQALRAGRALRPVEAGELSAVAEALGDCESHMGEFARAEASYRLARRWGGGLDRARLLYKVSLSADRTGSYRRALLLLTTAERAAGSDPGPVAARLIAEIRAQYGLVRFRQGRMRDAVRLLRTAVALAEAAGAPDVLAAALLQLDLAELSAGVEGSGEHATRALAIVRPRGDNPWLEARVLNRLGIRAYFAGRWPEAVDFYTMSRAASEQSGDRWTAAIESGNIAEVLSDQGHLEEAEPMLHEALGVFRAAGTPSFIADGTRMLGRLASRRRDIDRAHRLLNEARRIFEDDGESLQVCLTDAMRAECLLIGGQHADAADLAGQVVASLTSVPGGHLVLPLALRILAASSASGGDRDARARQALSESVEMARRFGIRYELAMGLLVKSLSWPEDTTAEEQAERDALFEGLGVIDGGRSLTAAAGR